MADYKHDEGKPRMDLIDPYFEEEMAKTLTTGAAKHGDYKWRKVRKARYVAALQRHLTEIKKGNVISDHGVPHAILIACNAMFIHWIDRKYSHTTKEKSNGNTDL
jgi:hypothetical protein